MEKRLVLAIALSILVLLTWSLLIPKPQPIGNQEVSTQRPPTATPVSQQTPLLSKEEEFPSTSLFKYEQDKFELTFIEHLAAIKEIKFKAHQGYSFPLKYGFLLGGNGGAFRKESSSSDSITFVQSDQNKKIKKQFIFSNSTYSIWLDIEYQNLSNSTLRLNLALILGVLDFSPSKVQARYQDVTIATKDKILHHSARKSLEFPEVKFLSLRDRYFCAIVEPPSENFKGFINKITPQESEIGLSSPEILLAPGEQSKQKFHIYLGPQELQLVNSIKPEWSAVINYGTFDFIAQIILQLLRFLNHLVHNWGWAIVLLSILVYLLLYPLTLKQMRSMKEMQVLQPQVEELRKLYKDNPQRLNKEIMELYRQHKVNPLGGCLPLILQMPIFIALYQALQRSVVLKGASFLWIKDLSEPDRLFILPISLPVLGNEINILPIVMAIGMFIQQKISMVSASSGSAEQQRLMMIIMPLMFGVIFYHMPSGLVLYWFINSSLMLLYQFRISRIK